MASTLSLKNHKGASRGWCHKCSKYTKSRTSSSAKGREPLVKKSCVESLRIWVPDIPVLHLRHKCTYVVRTTTYGTYLSLLLNPWVESPYLHFLMHFYELFGHGTRGQSLYKVCFSYLMPRLPSSHLLNLNDRRFVYTIFSLFYFA